MFTKKLRGTFPCEVLGLGIDHFYIIFSPKRLIVSGFPDQLHGIVFIDIERKVLYCIYIEFGYKVSVIIRFPALDFRTVEID